MPLLETSVPNILIVDDDISVIQVLSKALGGLGRLRFATNGMDALRLARHETPDLILLDAEMPGMSGFEVWDAMRSDPLLRELPMIFVTSHSEEQMEEQCLAHGAADFIAKPVRPAIVLARARTQLRLKQAIDRLREFAANDGLTGVANRRTLDARLTDELGRARRMGRPLSVLLLDVDFFKRYNDLYGHVRGDQALIAVTQVLKTCAHRPGDLVARYGGEEFAIVLSETDRAGAETVGRNILEQIAAMAMPHTQSTLGHLTVSIGLVTYNFGPSGDAAAAVPAEATELSVERLLGFADQALYAAKTAGRAGMTGVTIDVAQDLRGLKR